ncbi:Valine--tRNA ligase 1 [Andalucia godoyi]|uniref:Valine--tRNA ligase, mitochondrial n=1 Tax=Andalucia godoyi TaxID=505711 RepID=A0A8K0F143_ANDGO|nr:Valine--tRNA ligase 1 [Andalucia godoyi]|eukprot:ANDGO_05943.mRNA.1 Valine--tRNA ligase 1
MSLPKDVTAEMAAGYMPQEVEAKWYEWWESEGFFRPSGDSSKGKFVIVLPPPNVTGSLHLGHTLTCAIQDCLVRWHRMLGHDTLWVPGTDHAGIATQVVVEKKLQKEEGKSRHDYGRQAFLEKVFEWKDKSAGTIQLQLRRIAASLDWSREAFTMDPVRCESVTEAFIRLFEKGLIYRSTRLVNWCPALKTVLSDLEVEYIDVEKNAKIRVPGYLKQVEFGILVHFAYKVDGSETGEEIVVATTRPETMLGDSAIAIHPEDKRYKHLHGKFVRHPFQDRLIPIICDSVLVDMTFGTGAVKVTPAHDPNDFVCGKRHNLPEISVFDDDGKMNANGAPFQGLPRFECRTAIIKAMEQKGILKSVEGHAMRLGVCSRTGDVIEPMIKPQWFCNCAGMAARATQAARDKTLRIIPEWHCDTWYRWLDNIHDWCISRQLWWGHRIPAYCVRIAGQPNVEWVVARSTEEARTKAEAKFPGSVIESMDQDPDVLDTWFSSGLFPFSVCGWPNNTNDMARYFPGNLLETGHDILFFWVARMVMMSLELTDQLPFTEVFLHAMVRDKFGRKMSKSLGNVIDPIDVIHGISLEELGKKLEQGNLDPREVEKAKKGQKEQFPSGIPECGADALRFTLLNYTSQGRDINLDVGRVQGYRQWCNKLWNTIRFALLNFTGFVPQTDGLSALQEDSVQSLLLFADKWILSRLADCVASVNSALGEFDFGGATTLVYTFWLYELCDVYLESMKPVMRAGTDVEKRNAQAVLFHCLEVSLRLTHPFMPFLTEELWQHLPGIKAFQDVSGKCSIMLQDYPVASDVSKLRNVSLENDMKLVSDVVHAVRSMRASYNITSQKLQLFVRCRSSEATSATRAGSALIATLAQCEKVEVLDDESVEIPLGCGVQVLSDKVAVYVMLKGVIDADNEIKKLNKKLATAEASKDAIRKRVEMVGYEERVPEKVRQENTTKLQQLEVEISDILRGIDEMNKLK